MVAQMSAGRAFSRTPAFYVALVVGALLLTTMGFALFFQAFFAGQCTDTVTGGSCVSHHSSLVGLPLPTWLGTTASLAFSVVAVGWLYRRLDG
jgi:hypothetical protein